MDETKLRELQERALAVRRDIVEMIALAGSGHPGGSLSGVEIACALYFHAMRIRPAEPDWPERDRFVLSKGHAAPLLYAVLAQAGYFPREELKGLRRIDRMLQGHPDAKGTPGVEVSTGSLGQGIAVANGIALAGKLDGRDYRVYVLVGDGELQEGLVWEAAMAAAHYRLDNVTVFVDYNGFQIDGRIQDVMNPDPVPDKWRAFGWHVLEIDGHDFPQILSAIDTARSVQGKPTAVIARTVKGKGISFMENQVGWHGVAPKPDELERALVELAGWQPA